MKKILVSACLLGTNCKYSGGNNESLKVKEYLEKIKEQEEVEVISFCPECLGGFSIPREPVEYVNGHLIDKFGNSFDEKLELGKSKINALLDQYSFDLAILKAKSPSCGHDGIYDGTFTRTIVNRDGFAVELIKARNIQVISENDL